MFKFIFDLATEPLRLPIEWYYKWIILLVIGEIAYHVAYDKIGALYHSGSISGRAAGSFVHWIIRTVVFVAVVIAVKIFVWFKEQNELVKVSIKVEDNDNR